VALDDDAPRVVKIAGDRFTARIVSQTMSELADTPCKLQFVGTTGTYCSASLAPHGVSGRQLRAPMLLTDAIGGARAPGNRAGRIDAALVLLLEVGPVQIEQGYFVAALGPGVEVVE
jgi:hypothetical protein